ncbi:uncharacterized protein DFL_001245 [Arthrobotrys flagrans]|uniref:Uncharacterized protein n=1 Tax=Arthrobotrys flagrans TaxID=97331 RepID=A0A437AGN9_ARTFL|nr:hypothetical protein DFL_001245 [Arthrobotrys flagrans]
MAPYPFSLSLLLLASATATLACPFQNPDILGPIKGFPTGGDPVYNGVDSLKEPKENPKLTPRDPVIIGKLEDGNPYTIGLNLIEHPHIPAAGGDLKSTLKGNGLNILKDDRPSAETKPSLKPRDPLLFGFEKLLDPLNTSGDNKPLQDTVTAVGDVEPTLKENGLNVLKDDKAIPVKSKPKLKSRDPLFLGSDTSFLFGPVAFLSSGNSESGSKGAKCGRSLEVLKDKSRLQSRNPLEVGGLSLDGWTRAR